MNKITKVKENDKNDIFCLGAREDLGSLMKLKVVCVVDMGEVIRI